MTKPKVRKVAWVVLGVVVALAAATLAFQWDSIWLNVAYEEYWFGDSTDERHRVRRLGNGGDYVVILAWLLEILPPPSADQGFTLRKRVNWLPGPEHLVVFYSTNGREIGRYEKKL